MPSTAAHIPVQALATRLSLPSFDPRWMLLGCVLPDVPWIVQRVLGSLPVSPDPYALRLYLVVQASLLFTLLAAGALALLARRRGLAFATLGVGALVHLLLDGVETKWGNAPHLIAPFSWAGFELDLFWPDHPASYLLAGLGLLYLPFAWRRARRTGPPLDLTSPARTVGAGALLALYLAVPPLLAPGAFRADAHFVRTLSGADEPPGTHVELDRARYRAGHGGGHVLTFAGERLALARPLPVGEDATVSVRGRFTDEGRLAVTGYHVHDPFARDLLTLVALAGIAAVWLRALIPGRSREGPVGRGPP